MESFNLWCREVNHAVFAGRQIVCLPVSGSIAEEIESLGTGLGYVLWPSITILAPPIERPADDHPQPAAGEIMEIKTERGERTRAEAVGEDRYHLAADIHKAGPGQHLRQNLPIVQTLNR